MADKGKGQAIVEVEDDSDDELAYFTAKKRTYTRPMTPPRLSPPKNKLSDVSEDDSDENGERPKKKKRKKKRSAPKLPEWTRQSSTEIVRKRSVGRSSTKERWKGDAIAINDSCDVGKGKASTARARIQLTPPPELSEERKAELRAAMDRYFAPAPVDPVEGNDQTLLSDPITPSSLSASSDTIIITVRMVADPQRTAAGASANAVKAYERGRQINLRREQPLSVVYHFLAGQLGKQPDDIVLVYNGQKIYSTSVTPKSLLMAGSVELAGYESGHWDRLQKEKQRERQLLLADGSPSRELDGSASPDPEPVEPILEPFHQTKLRLSLRGKWGEHKMNADEGVTAAVMVKWYCLKAGLDPSSAEKLRLQIDGELVRPETAVRDMEVEDKDQVDIL